MRGENKEEREQRKVIIKKKKHVRLLFYRLNKVSYLQTERVICPLNMQRQREHFEALVLIEEAVRCHGDGQTL